MENKKKIISIDIEDELKNSYIDYSMSVIVSRALPDVRDGLKPVHRRVLYGMYQLGMLSNKPYKKSARIVGEVLGKYHPHGDSSVYDTIVRMAQSWSLRYKLIDGQGNFGSIDSDPPAAMRYTEVRLNKISEEMLQDIHKNTVDMKLNFDDSMMEPSVLPSRIPNLLINGVSGIAVGMATNMPPHNLGQTINAICAYIENKNISIDSLINIIEGPDFPTGGIIYGYNGIKEAFLTGKGKVVLRAKTHFEKINNRNCIIVDEIPYQVNKEEMIKKIINLIKIGKLNDLHDIKDESNHKGIRVVFFIKNHANSLIVLNNLFKYSSLEICFNINNIALVNGKPVLLNLKNIIKHFVNHRHDIVIRKIKYDLIKSKKELHLTKGLMFALNNFNSIIAIIKNTNNYKFFVKTLSDKYNLSEKQSKAIFNMKLRRFSGLEQDDLTNKFHNLTNYTQYLNNLLSNKLLRMNIIKKDLLEIRDKYLDKRLTKIVYSANASKIEDLIPNQKVLLTISSIGYIKRTPLSDYKTQKRGGIGNKAAIIREEDFLEHLLVANNHQYILLFTETGKCFWLRVFDIPESSKHTKGKPVQNLINLTTNDRVKAYVLIDNISNHTYINNHYLLMVTKKGLIKRSLLKNYSKPRKNGIISTIIRKDDALLEVSLTEGDSDVLIALKSGKAIRFSEKNIRSMGRISSGVRGIVLSSPQDSVIGMICVDKNKNNNNVLVVSEKGFGKKTSLKNYRITNRGGKGIKTMNITKKTGHLISIKNVHDNDDLMIINKSGLLIRISIAKLRLIGRATQGVKLINIKKNDKIAAVTKVSAQ